MSNAELATSYAVLILADDSVDITPDKLQTLLKAAGVDDVEPIWTSLFAKALDGKDVKDLLLNVGSGGGAAAAPATGGATGGAAAPEAEEVETKEEGTSATTYPELGGVGISTNPFAEKEESDEDMGFGLFD